MCDDNSFCLKYSNVLPIQMLVWNIIYDIEVYTGTDFGLKYHIVCNRFKVKFKVIWHVVQAIMDLFIHL